MPRQTAVYRRNTQFAFRLRVPARLVSLIGRKFLKRSLRTGNPTVASLRGARLLRAARELFQRLETQRSMLKRDEIEEMVRGFYAVEFEDWRLSRYVERPDGDALAAQDEAWEELPTILEQRGHELETGLWHPANELIPKFKALFGIEIAPRSRDENLLREYLMRALRQLAADQIAVLAHRYENAEVLDPLFRRPLPDPAAVGVRARAPAAPAPAGDSGSDSNRHASQALGPNTDPLAIPGSGGERSHKVFGDALRAALAAGVVEAIPADLEDRHARFHQFRDLSPKAVLTIPEVFNDFIEAKEVAARTEKTLNDYRRSLAAFVEMAGLKPVGAYKVWDVENYLAVLQKVPARHRVILKTTSYRAAAELNEAAGPGKKLRPMTPGSINNKYLTNVFNFFRWAKRRSMIEQNPAEDMQIEAPRGAPKKARRPFTTNELQTIFTASVFKGCKSESQFMVDGAHQLRNRYFWVPLLALFSGCRLNELGLLRRGHVVQDEDDKSRWWLHITTNADPEDVEDAELLRNLKSEAAERRVLLHPFLVEKLGFLDYLRSLPKATIAACFPIGSRAPTATTQARFRNGSTNAFSGRSSTLRHRKSCSTRCAITSRMRFAALWSRIKSKIAFWAMQASMSANNTARV